MLAVTLMMAEVLAGDALGYLVTGGGLRANVLAAAADRGVALNSVEWLDCIVVRVKMLRDEVAARRGEHPMVVPVLALLQDIGDNTCGWLIRVPSGRVEIDFPEDRFIEVECGATLRPHGKNGQICDHGHEFGNLEDRYAPFGAEWQREMEEAF